MCWEEEEGQGCSLLPPLSWGVLVGRAATLRDFGWAQLLALSRTVAVGRIRCHRGVLSCTAFSLWVSGCSQEQLLNWDLSSTRPRWEGDPEASPSGGSVSGRSRQLPVCVSWRTPVLQTKTHSGLSSWISCLQWCLQANAEERGGTGSSLASPSASTVSPQNNPSLS